MKNELFEEESLRAEDREAQLINRYLIIGWTVVNTILFAAYLIEAIKGMRSHLYFAVFMAVIWIPELVVFILYKKKPYNHRLKNYIIEGYVIMYSFVLITGYSTIVFTYILPLLSMLILYHDKKLIFRMGIVALAMNILFIAIRFFNGMITVDNSSEYEIEIGILILCFGGCYMGSGIYDNIHRTNHSYMKKLNDDAEFIQELTIQSITAIVNTIDAKDEYTKGHSQRVAEYSYLIAKELKMNEYDALNIKYVALLHDIGKIAIPDAILKKAGRLTDDEFAVMKSHSDEGAKILKDINIMPELDVGARHHHERYDGKGYPYGIKGDEIPLTARIICVADSYDAMSSNRVYRPRLTDDEILKEIKRCTGTQFDPEVANAFVRLLKAGKIHPADQVSA